jgi:hypothetical protein
MKNFERDGATPWRERPYLSMKDAAEIAVCSRSSLYTAAGDGRLSLRRLNGRTLVETASLISFLDTAEKWTPSGRSKKATDARSEAARASWQS